MKTLPLAILCGLFFGSLGTFTAVWTVLFLVRGELLEAIVSVAVSVFCYGFIIPFFKLIPGNIAPRAKFDDESTTFRPDRGMDIPIHVSMLGGVVASALIVVLAPLGKLDVPVPPFMRYSLPLTSAVIVAMGAPILWRNFQRGSSRYLRLTPAGFEVAQGWRPQSGDWDDVRDVTDAVPGQQTPTPNAVVFVMSDDSATSLVAGAITPEGTALRRLVRFYWQHCDYRAELTDGRAVERLANEQFDVEQK